MSNDSPISPDVPDSAARRWGVRLSMLVLFGAMLFAALWPKPTQRIYPQRQQVRFWHMWSGEWKDKVDQIVQEFNQSQEQYEVVALSIQIPLLIPRPRRCQVKRPVH